MAADKIAHVLDEAEQRDVDFLKHHHALPHIVKRDFLGRRDRHRPTQGHELREGELGISRSWRKVNEQVVQFAPVHVSEELLDGCVNHGASPDDSRLLRNKIPHRDDLDPVALGRLDLPIFLLGWCRNPHHHGNVGPVHVGIHQADFCSGEAERHRKIDSHGRFPDPAFAAADRDHVFDVRDEVVFTRAPPLLSLFGIHLAHALYLVTINTSDTQ